MAKNDVYLAYRERLAQLVEERDAVNKSVAPKLEELNRLNAVAEEAKLAADALARDISDLRGGQHYLDVKKEIAALSSMLSGK